MPLLMGLNLTLLVGGSQMRMVYENTYTYQAPQGREEGTTTVVVFPLSL